MKNDKQEPDNKFKNAVEATPHISTAYKSGLVALGKYKDKVEMEEPRLLDGSIDIDEAVRERFPQSNRWDYALSYNSEVFFIEVHSAQTSEVSVVLKKLQWLKNWLHQHAPELNKLKPIGKDAFYWIQSKNFKIPKQSRQYLQIIKAGLKPIPKLVLN